MTLCRILNLVRNLHNSCKNIYTKMKSKKKKKLKEESEQEIKVDSPNQASEESIIKEINIDFKDKYVRLYSEFENYRKRTAKEKIEIITNASENLLKEIIPILDDFERAMDNNKKVEEISNVKEGFELIHNKIYKTLTNQGLKPMNSLGKSFDPDIHEAITKIPATKDKMKGKVMDVIEKGYILNDKVIRFAKVVVGE